MISRNQLSDAQTLPMLDVVGLYAEGEVDLTGKASALRELADILVAAEPVLVRALSIPEEVSPSPYDGFLAAVRVIRDDGLVEIRQEDRVLVITGSLDNLSILAENISFVADGEVSSTGIQYHSHIEYYPDNGYLAFTTLPLIVTLETNTDEISK